MPDDPTHTPYASGHFDVADGHRLYYERFGTPGGEPILFVHGGPGAGFSDEDKGFFDPDRFDVLLFEQRGAGRSEPFASLAHNDTDALVDDIDKLLDHFDVTQTMLFGGSWGSTLSLVYAIRRPHRVRGMILRGIFLADRAALDHFVGGGVAPWFPEVWERFVDLVPPSERHDIAGYYGRKMASDDDAERERFCYEWARYELSLVKLDGPGDDLDELLRHYSYRSLAPLEAHYIGNNCFLPDGYILEHAPELTMPSVIVHGRYDVICPAEQAYRLHRALPNARVRFVTAGHSSSEPAIHAALIEEAAELPNP